MKKIGLILILCAMLLFSGCNGNTLSHTASNIADDDKTTNENAIIFPDVGEIHWAYEEISYWAKIGVFNGYKEGYFYPEQDITRAEVAKIIALAFNLQGDVNENQTFQDVPTDHWAHPYVELCTVNGIFQGYNENTFAPGQPMSRNEAVTVLYRTKKIHAENPRDALLNMSDWYSVPAWAIHAMGAMIEQGLIKGYPNGTIQSGSKITRSEFAALLYRVEMYKDASKEDENKIIENILCGEAGTITKVQVHNKENWLFLPAGADLTKINMSIQFRDGMECHYVWSGNLGETESMSFDLTKLAAIESDGSYTLTIRASTDSYKEEKIIRVLQSSNVDAVFLTSKDEKNRGMSYVDSAKGNSIKGEMTYLNADGTVVYQGSLSQIKSRGNSTFVYYPKKSYQIKLDTKTDLLGVGENVKTWVLLANFGDPTQMRDKLCKDLSLDLQIEGTPNCNWVDLYFDGISLGTYLISEKVDVGEEGLNITELEKLYENVNVNYGNNSAISSDFNRYGNIFYYISDLNDPDDISDGYVLELNYQKGDENCWFLTKKNFALNVKIPENLSRQAMMYISEFYQQFEDAVYSENGINPENGKSFDEYCDLTSLVKIYMVYMFSNNQDAYVQSTFFYLKDGKLYAGPIWDSDQSFGIGWKTDVAADAPLKWSYLIEGLEQIPAFQTAVKEYYNTVFRSVALEYIEKQVYEYSAFLKGTERINHIIWPIYYRWSGLGKAYENEFNYSKIVDSMCEWMRQRIEYMDIRFS